MIKTVLMELGGLLVNLGAIFHHYRDDISALSTVTIAVFTVVLGTFTVRLASSTRNAANAARDAAKVAERSLFDVQRAFVFARCLIKGVRGSALVVDVEWRNTGTTPAKRFVNWVNNDTFEGSIPENFIFPDIKGPDILNLQDEFTALCVAPPQASLIGKAIIPLSNLKLAGTGTHRVYVWGWCEYDDIFEGTKRRRTEFCVWLQPVSATDASAEFIVKQHHKHNGTDEDCVNPLRTQEHQLNPRR